jgi:hypothetical protein
MIRIIFFESREELIQEVMAVGIQRLRQHVEEVLEGLPAGMPPMDRIVAGEEPGQLADDPTPGSPGTATKALPG